MLEKARSRGDRVGATNLMFVQGDDNLSKVEGKFDLITSHIVLQHIPVQRGERMFGRLLDLLNAA